jgi:ubiquinone/menaquinone biosynthesis C-methylase UbiE
VARHVRLREFLVGVEGLALLRGLFTGTDESAQRRIDDVRRLVADEQAELYGLGADTPEHEVTEGYARWSTTYDAPGNPLVSAEQATVWGLIDGVPAGRALDAACGTGRHAKYLAEKGHEVTGIDATPEMLAQAQKKVPNARFELGHLTALPFPDGSFDLAVCALALDHVADFAGAIAELARVVRPGGHVISSDLHPVVTALGGAAFFRDADGASGIVRVHAHSHAEYLDAFAAAGLTVRQCLEPRFGPAEVEMQQPAWSFIPEATTAAYLDLPAALIWDLTVSP